MRQIAIGDIHGRSSALDALLRAIKPGTADQIITLGDYVDGSVDSPGVLDRLIALASRCDLVSIRGNHDQMMLDARSGEFELELWCALGGQTTLDAYPGRSIDAVPDRHWWFLEETCVDIFESERHLFVHAHVDPRMPAKTQVKKVMHWRSLELAQPHMSYKVVVCGHTSQKNGLPIDLGHTICLDTAGWLTSLDVNSGHVVQANQAGEVRKSFL